MNGEKSVPEDLLHFLRECLDNGAKFVKTNSITKQVQKRTHRKRRINKKWLKRYGTKNVPDDSKLIVAGCIYGTPNAIESVKAAMKKRWGEDGK